MATNAAAPPAAIHDALRLLARKLLEEGHPLQAIKALYALLAQSLMPADEASVRLQLGQLLIEHTRNGSDAKKQLQRADMIASQLPGDFSLKARVLAALAAVHRALHEPAAFERGAFERGLETCRAAAAVRSDDWRSGGPMQDWAVYFRMRLAEMDAREGNPAAAAAALEEAVTGGNAAAMPAATANAATATPNAAATNRQFPRFVEPRHRLPALMFRIQLAMARGDADDARRCAEAAASLFARLDAPDAMPPEDEREQQLLYYSKLHFNVLQIMMYVRMGEFETLLSQGAGAAEQEEQQQGGGAGGNSGGGGGGSSGADAAVAAAVAYMEDLHEQTEEYDPPYDWLPREAMAAVVHLLAVSVRRAGSAGQAREAARHADLGLAALAPALSALGCADAADAARAASAGRPLPPLVNEQGLDRRDMSRAALLLSLRILLGEARVQSRLLATDLAGARSEVAAQMLLVERFPGLLARLLPTVHMQAGLYAQAVGVWPAADAHFAAAIDTGRGGGGGGGGRGRAQGMQGGDASAAQPSYLGPDRATAVAAASYRALVSLAALPGPEAVARGASAMGPLYANAVGGGGGGGGGNGGPERPGDLTQDLLNAAPGLPGNADRGASHLAIALLRLRAGDVTSAKQRLNRAMRLGHGRLRSQQLLQQALHSMAPLTADGGGGGGTEGGGAGDASQGGGVGGAAAGGAVAAPAHNDYRGAETMLASTSTMCRNGGNVAGQVAALELLEQLFARMMAVAGGGGPGGTGGGAAAAAAAEPELARKAAQNSNYLEKKRGQLSERLAAAEGSSPAEHRAVLAWGLGS